MPSFDTVTSVERVQAPSPEVFREEFVQRRKPVILTGVADRWPAFSEWTPERLRSAAGDAVVTVHYDDEADFQRWYHTAPGKRPDRRIPLREFLDLLQADPPERRYYMTEHDLSTVSQDLVGDVDMSRYLPGSRPFLFLGRDTCMPAHYHATTEAVMCQLRGSKKITLWGPEWFDHLSPRPWYADGYVFSEIDGRTQRLLAEHRNDEIDHERYPRIRETRPLQFTVNPGEILFIPVHWWHLTSAQGLQVSCTYFWLSERKRWHYPKPALQVHAHEILRRSRLGVSKLRSKLTGSRGARAGVH